MPSRPCDEIDRRLFLQYLAAAGLAGPIVAGRASAAAPSVTDASVDARGLVGAFANPPQGAGPGAYWYWLGGNVTRAGITADLEAMHAAGIWNPMLFAIGKSGPDTLIKPPADALTPVWWELVEHAASEAARLGLILSLNCCDGWATASGPWITPELSMQCVVWSEQTIDGGRHFDGTLAKPAAKHDYYREIATIALPYPREWEETSFTRRASIATNLPLKVPDTAVLSDPDNTSEVVDTQQPGWIDYTFDTPFTLRSIRVHTPAAPGYAPGVYRAANSLEVQASDDGKTFRRIGALEYPRHGWQTDLTTLTHSLPQTTARYFRLVHREIPPQPYEEEYDFGQDTRLRFFSIVLSSEPRIHHPQGKSGAQWALSRRTRPEDLPDSACVPLRDIVDLTSRLDPTGRVVWEAPPGRWRILRIGYTTTGTQNSAAGGAQGLECDRFSPAAARLQFDSWFGRALHRVGPSLAGKVLHVLHVDSWEAGAQNWSPDFAAGFRELRGYDLLPYIATMTGVPVASADVSERVLLDVRRTINDLMQRGFFQTLASLAHRNGCLFSAEPANPTFPADGLEHISQVDWPMGEFWLNTPRNDKPTDIKDAVCGSRLYGKRIAAAESFTQGLMQWDEHPFTFKALGDRIYCEGINRFMLHVYAHQPWLDRAPGITLNGIGTFFSRTQTWWRPGRAWFDYLRRCQALLQEGLAVADVCYFTGENVPARALLPRQLSVAIPEGYAYDCINRDGLLHQTEVREGWIALRSGGRYRVLVLPNDVLMTPEIATRLRDLARAGALIMGPRPQCSPSLMGFPAADATVREVAIELWGDDSDGTQHTDRRVGSGRVVWGKPLDEVLTEASVPADFTVLAGAGTLVGATAPGVSPSSTSSSGLPTVHWTHRRGSGWDLYFLSNPSNQPLTIGAAFRVIGRRPELWHADSGETSKLALWHEEAGRTVVPLSLDPGGSVFVIFAQPTGRKPFFTAISGANSGAVQLDERNGRVAATVSQEGAWALHTHDDDKREFAVRELPGAVALDGPWIARFADRVDRPIELTLHTLASWTEQGEENVKYYSGTALYTTDFSLSREQTGQAQRLFLELGEVRDLVEIRVNGQHIGVLWKPPFTVEITRAVHAGDNKLELAVTNTWRNRLIGDYGKEPGERTTFVVPPLRLGKPWLPGGAGAVPSPAGLLGPVRIRCAAVVAIT
jgi:alpha-L-rhamnosidase